MRTYQCFLDVNQAAIDHYGYSREEFLSMTLREIRPVEDLEKYEKFQSDRRKCSTLLRTAARHLKKSGEIIFVDLSVQSIDFNGKKAGVVVAVDVTEKRKAEKALNESIERFNIVLEATSDVIYDWNVHANALTWNNMPEQNIWS